MLRLAVLLAWTCWAVLFGALLVLAALESGAPRSPEIASGLGSIALGLGFAALVGLAGLLYRFATRRQALGVVAMAIVLAWCVVVIAAGPILGAYRDWQHERGQARVGRFEDATLQPMAAAISRRDCAALGRQLEGRSPPPGTDAAGHDLLTYAVLAVRDRSGDPSCVRALLEVGVDPDNSRMPGGSDLLNYLVIDPSPRAREVFLALLAHGADPNAIDLVTGNAPLREAGSAPELVRALTEAGADLEHSSPTGVPALVGFVSERHWEAALYLVEQGARLDWQREGLSLDYYLRDWRDSVYGTHPEGWDRLRAALVARGKTLPR